MILGKIGKKNAFYDILEGRNAFVDYKNKKFNKVEKLGCLQSPWFWSKIGNFSRFLFFRKIGHKNVFHDILEGRNAFLYYKNKNFNKSTNWDFSKGVSPWFWSKIGNFFRFLF